MSDLLAPNLCVFLDKGDQTAKLWGSREPNLDSQAAGAQMGLCTEVHEQKCCSAHCDPIRSGEVNE